MPKSRNTAAIALLGFVMVSVAYLAWQEFRPESQASATQAPARGDQVVATYFHGRARCVTCQRLETYAEEALRTGFPEELASERLVWRVIDISQPANRHFVEDYRLKHQSVVLAEMEDGERRRWTKLDQIWQKVHDKEDYVGYVQEEVRRFLSGPEP